MIGMSLPLAYLHGDFGRVGLVNMDSRLAVHVHHHCHFVFKVGGDATTFNVSGRNHLLTAENVILVNSWEPHSWSAPRSSAETLFLTFYIEPRWLGEVFESSGQNSTALRAGRSSVLIGPECRERVGSLVAALMSIWRNEGAALALVTAIVKEIVLTNWTLPSIHHAPARAHDYRIRRAMTELNSTGTTHRLEQVAQNVGLSRSHFFELFREQTGLSPMFYVNATRTESAIKQLIRSNVSLIDLADELGFSTQGNFTRFFRQHVGVTPNKFRNIATNLCSDVARQAR